MRGFAIIISPLDLEHLFFDTFKLYDNSKILV